MEQWGNGRANKYWEENMPAHVARPKEGDSVRVVERFIRDKYENKKYIGSTIPEKTIIESAVVSDEEEDTKIRRKKTVRPVSKISTVANIQSKPAPVVPVQAKSTPAVSLLDLFDCDISPSNNIPKETAKPLSVFGGFSDPFDPFSSSNSQNNQQPTTQQNQQAIDPFSSSNFSQNNQQSQQSQPSNQQIFQQQDIFPSFQENSVTSAPPPVPTQAPSSVPVKQLQSAESILSLYGNSQSNTQQYHQQQPNMMMQQQHNQGGNQFGGNNMQNNGFQGQNMQGQIQQQPNMMQQQNHQQPNMQIRSRQHHNQGGNHFGCNNMQNNGFQGQNIMQGQNMMQNQNMMQGQNMQGQNMQGQNMMQQRSQQQQTNVMQQHNQQQPNNHNFPSSW
jgi:hypothetical protein